jgi:hypothetical protein
VFGPRGWQRDPAEDNKVVFDLVTGTETEPHAGYYVASQSRPPNVTNMTTDEIASVFDLVERVSKLPKEGAAGDAKAVNGARQNGNGKHPHLQRLKG